jgi:hypothetical protein
MSILSDHWKRLIDDRLQQLEREDQRRVRETCSWTDVQSQILQKQSSGTIHPEMLMLAPSIEKLRKFVDELLANSIVDLNAALFWGMLRLVISVGIVVKT